jgi:hypothetical protein
MQPLLVKLSFGLACFVNHRPPPPSGRAGVAKLCRLVRTVVFSGGLGLLAGCQTTAPMASSQRFSEAPFVDVGLRFASWDCIFLTRPQVREAGFEPIFTRETIGPALAQLPGRRAMCAVVVHAGAQDEALGGVVQDWTGMLRAAGFARVVFLRAGFAADSLNGLEILEDTQAQAAQ